MDVDIILETHKLRKTTFRRSLLAAFYNSKASLTADEIRETLGNTGDKVTVYRALDAFEKKGIIHKVPDKNNLIRYALCGNKCGDDSHTHNHAHFICESCSKTFCIEDIEVPEIVNAKGFQIKKSKLTLEGQCPTCTK